MLFDINILLLCLILFNEENSVVRLHSFLRSVVSAGIESAADLQLGSHWSRNFQIMKMY